MKWGDLGCCSNSIVQVTPFLYRAGLLSWLWRGVFFASTPCTLPLAFQAEPMGQSSEAFLRNTWVGWLVHLQLWVINQSGGLHRRVEFIHHSYQLVKWFSRTDVGRTKSRGCLGWGGVQLCEPNRGSWWAVKLGTKMQFSCFWDKSIAGSGFQCFSFSGIVI